MLSFLFCEIHCVLQYARFFVFQAEDGIRDLVRSRGLGDVYKRQGYNDYKHDERERTGELGTRFKNRELETRVELLHLSLIHI